MTSFQETRKRTLAFVLFVTRNTIEDKCSFIASGLTVTTMLSLVPLMTVIFSVLSAFPAYSTVGDDIQEYLFTHFVPNSGAQIKDYLSSFVAQASRLKAVGIAILVITALLLMRTIDKAFNVIWHTQDNRRPILVFLVYWAVLSLGPIFLGLSIGLTSYFITLPMVSTAFAHIGQIVKTGLPFLLTAMALSLMYWVIPNKKIRIRDAAIAGLLAAALFELAKSGFSFYITNVPSYQIIFGALAVIPIFLIWMYLSWIIVLLGAEICHALGTFSFVTSENKNRLLLAVNVIEQALLAFREGKALEKRALVEQGLCDEKSLEEVVQVLYEKKWLVAVDEDQFLLGRDISTTCLYDLLATLPWPLPEKSILDDKLLLHKSLLAAHGQLQQALEVDLVSLFQNHVDNDDEAGRV